MCPTDLLEIHLCACRDIIKSAWCWRLQCSGTSMHTKASKSCLWVKPVNCIYFLLLLTHLLRERTFVTCSVFPALHRLSLSLPVCVGHTRYLLHPLNSQGLWNAYALLSHENVLGFFLNYSRCRAPPHKVGEAEDTQSPGSGGSSRQCILLCRESLLCLPPAALKAEFALICGRIFKMLTL